MQLIKIIVPAGPSLINNRNVLTDDSHYICGMVIQLTGLSGAGKTTLANKVKLLLEQQQLKVEIIDGDVYRNTLCKDLGFSKEDRCENIRRLGKAAKGFSGTGAIAIIAAINPFEAIRIELEENYDAKTIWIKCAVDVLTKRDTKGLYKRAALPDEHPDKLHNLTGVNDVYEAPALPHLVIDTTSETADASAEKMYRFIIGIL
jgi:adenylylsulfate kinase